MLKGTNRETIILSCLLNNTIIIIIIIVIIIMIIIININTQVIIEIHVLNLTGQQATLITPRRVIIVISDDHNVKCKKRKPLKDVSYFGINHLTAKSLLHLSLNGNANCESS